MFPFLCDLRGGDRSQAPGGEDRDIAARQKFYRADWVCAKKFCIDLAISFAPRLWFAAVCRKHDR
jgi:hypothetical protein